MNGLNVKAYSRAKDGLTKVAANFRVNEFACTDATDTVFIAEDLPPLLQKIRDHFKKSVTINSGYRTETKNKACGGAPYSQHKYGAAADIVIAGVTPLEVAGYAETLLGDHGGIGVYQSFTHVDVRKSRSRWDCRSGKETAVKGW